MDLSERVLGHTIALELQARTRAAVLTIGKDRFTRSQLASRECFNFIAAQRLTKLFVEMGVKDTRDVYHRLPPTALAVPTLGAISLAVLGAAFEAVGLGGEHPLETWFTKHAANKEHPIITFYTIKQKLHRRDAEGKKREVADSRRRRRRVRQQEHEAGVQEVLQ